MVIEVIGLVFSVVIGTIGHFLYDWSNKNTLIGFLFAKNESTWEHIKLGITPIIFWTIIELFTFDFEGLFFTKFISIITFMLLLLVIYYGYKFIFKMNSLIFDILLFYVCLGISYIVSIKLLNYCYGSLLNIIGLIGICFIIFLYYYFNKKTPNLIIFKEP